MFKFHNQGYTSRFLLSSSVHDYLASLASLNASQDAVTGMSLDCYTDATHSALVRSLATILFPRAMAAV